MSQVMVNMSMQHTSNCCIETHSMNQ